VRVGRKTRCGAIRRLSGARARLWTAGLLLAIFPGTVQAQAAGIAAGDGSGKAAADGMRGAQGGQETAQTAAPGDGAKTDTRPSDSARRRAAKLFLESSRLFLAGRFEEARQGFEKAAALDPLNADYRRAALVARSHEVTALLQTAAQDRLRSDEAGARAALTRAFELDPKNFEVNEHLDELGDDALRGQPQPLYESASSRLGGPVELEPSAAKSSFHLRAYQRQLIEQVFKAYGLIAMIDDSVPSRLVRLDLDDASFAGASHALGLLTDTFYVPLDPHRVLVAGDTRQNREKFTREYVETVYLSGLSAEEMTVVTNLAREVFQAQRVAADNSAGTITIRAPELDLTAFNTTMRGLLDGRSEVMLDVRMIQVAHTNERNTGVTPPQAITAFNVYAEEQSLLNANQSLVQQIISSGLAAPGDTLAILGILLASGQISSSLFSNGLALFGGGITQSALAPGTVTANLALNSSQSRELDDVQLRLDDGQDGTLKLGTRYPIVTSQYSSLSASVPSIPGLNGAGSSSNLNSLVSELSQTVPPIPQVQYQDVGLTLKVTPRVMRNGNVALSMNLQLDGLAGTSINGLPVLDNRSYTGVTMIGQDQGVVVVGELDKSESGAITGTPGLSEIPGMNNLTGKDVQQNYATLVIIITPHVVRGTQAAGHSPMLRVDQTMATP